MQWTDDGVVLLAELRFGNLAIPLTPLCQCISKETLKAVDPFYLVAMPGKVKDPTQGAMFNLSGTTPLLEKDNS